MDITSSLNRTIFNFITIIKFLRREVYLRELQKEVPHYLWILQSLFNLNTSGKSGTYFQICHI